MDGTQPSKQFQADWEDQQNLKNKKKRAIFNTDATKFTYNFDNFIEPGFLRKTITYEANNQIPTQFTSQYTPILRV